VKAVAATLGVARSNVIERRDAQRPRRGPQERPGDVELAGAIRDLVDKRPTYGYRRIAALLRRERRAAGEPQVNVKRVYRLMKKHDLTLERHTGRRRPRAHDGQVATIRSNCRWCSDTLEFACWNGEIVRVAFALDCHDREAICWVATTAGISGEMIRDMMVGCVEKRFGAIRAPQPVQWLSDNGSIFAAHKTLDIATALNLAPCFTPVESPESNGMAGGAAVDRRAPVAGVLGDMRCGVALAQGRHERGGIVGLVGADRDAAVTRSRVGHGQRRLALGRAGGQGQPRIDRQSVAVLHQHVAKIGQFCRLARPLAVQPRLGVGGRGMRLVAVLLAGKVALAVAPRPRRPAAAMLRAKALHAGPGFDQRASTEKCPLDNNSFTRGWFSTLAMNLAAISPSTKRSRFLVNTVTFQIGASIPSPTNQRNSKF
jgi:putative transposase